MLKNLSLEVILSVYISVRELNVRRSNSYQQVSSLDAAQWLNAGTPEVNLYMIISNVLY